LLFKVRNLLFLAQRGEELQAHRTTRIE